MIAFCSIVTLGGIIYVIDFLSSRILQWISSIVSGKLETICNLLQSLIRYLSVFMGLYLTLNFLGFPVETIVTSLGLVTLSLSLGAKDLAADIIAGLPEEDEKVFTDTLSEIIGLGADNITIHTLSVKKGSRLKENDPVYYRKNAGTSGDQRTVRYDPRTGKLLRCCGCRRKMVVYNQCHCAVQ